MKRLWQSTASQCMSCHATSRSIALGLSRTIEPSRADGRDQLVSLTRGGLYPGWKGRKPLPPFTALARAGTKRSPTRGTQASRRGRGRALTSTAIALHCHSDHGAAPPAATDFSVCPQDERHRVRPRRAIWAAGRLILKPGDPGQAPCITHGQVGRDRMPTSAPNGRRSGLNSSRLDHRHDTGSVRTGVTGRRKSSWPTRSAWSSRGSSLGELNRRARSVAGAAAKLPHGTIRDLFEGTCPRRERRRKLGSIRKSSCAQGRSASEKAFWSKPQLR